MEIRPAVLDDLPAIMAIEEGGFPGMEASEKTMKARIKLCNERPPYYFLVAEHNDEVVADIIAQPTHMPVDACVSWEASTDNGTLKGTFDRTGCNLNIVSLGGPNAPPGAADMLVFETLLLWQHLPGAFTFNARMPGFQKVKLREPELTAWEYYARRHVVNGVDHGPRDSELHYYWLMFGKQEPYRCNVDGFKPDVESGGHSALFALFDKEKALRALARQLYADGRKIGA